MTMYDDTRAELQKRYDQIAEELSDLELRMMNARYRSLEMKDAGARRLREEVQALKQKAAEAGPKIRGFAASSSQAWAKFRDGMENAWEDLRSSCSSACDEFRKKVPDGADPSGSAECCSSTAECADTSFNPTATAATGERPAKSC